ncbi:MAG TPA: hypothetical protein VLA16_26370, partial [Ideonella sp.]|nr:hypothetical protein [Ideonella sp.]
MSRQNLSALFVALLLSWGCSSAIAQNSTKPSAPKAAATPAQAGTKTLDGSSPNSGKVMGINELKECLRRQDELKTRGAELEGQRVALDADRKKVEDETAGIKTLQTEVTQRNDAVKAF